MNDAARPMSSLTHVRLERTSNGWTPSTAVPYAPPLALPDTLSSLRDWLVSPVVSPILLVLGQIALFARSADRATGRYRAS